MRRLLTSALVIGLAVSGFASDASRPGVAHANNVRGEVSNAQQAAEALFVRSSVDDAKRFAAMALKRDATDPQALFVRMEAATLEGDVAAELDAALRLCAGQNGATDYAEIAAGHIRERATNTAEFRKALPRLRTMAATSAQRNELRLALVDATEDGVPEFNLLQQSRESGLLTDWKFLGPIGKLPNIDFDKKFDPEMDGLKKNIYNGKHVEYAQFVNGKFSLPSYMRKQGVFYAASRIVLRSGGDWVLRVETPGTMKVFIDGRLVITREDRRETVPQVIVESQHIDGGEHTVMVKFVSAAAPFRIAIMAPTGVLRRKNKPTLHAGPEAEYVSAALHYYRGDAAASVSALNGIAARRNSAPVQFALAHAWQHIAGEEDPPERADALRAAVRLAPSASAVEVELAAREYTLDHTEDALQQLKRSLARNAESERGLQLLSRIAVRCGWMEEATSAVERMVQVHPSCAILEDAADQLTSAGEKAKAAKLELQMQHCSPGSLTYANWLSAKGRHMDAARAAEAAIRGNPTDREARELEIRELVLSGDVKVATSQASALAQLAPGSARYGRATSDPARLLNSESQDNGFAEDAEFYRGFRRDGLKMVRDTASRKYSGGPAVTLLEDKVALLNEDGSGAVYVHRITRLLGRDGIEQYGEVNIPAGAHVLELRTIKADFSLVEPELNQHKATISMPALAPGDAIEQEYVEYLAGGNALATHSDAYAFRFGSFSAPILYSKFVLIAPKKTSLGELNHAPAENSVALAGGKMARVWARDDVAQSTRENAMPQMDLLPLVKVIPPQEDAAQLRAIAANAALDATHPGPRTQALAERSRRATAEQTARELYRAVTSSVRGDNSSFATGELTSAEASLCFGEGSRTATLLALASAANIRAELVLARTTTATPNAYLHPLVLFHFGLYTVAADPETEGMPFGSVAPALDRSAALMIPLATAISETEIARVSLPQATSEERSVATGRLDFDSDGSFAADVSITMGAYRGAQMRDILRGIALADRSQFFEQLALRLFPGAVDATGSVRNENDVNQPLVLLVKCLSQHFLDLSALTVDMDQLVPALGLRRMYTTVAQRKFPLYVDALLFETASFRVRLPQGVTVARNAPDYEVENEFGRYAVSFRSTSASEVEITREFHVPVQLIEPLRYAEFARFANRIDEAERQRLTLKVTPPLTAQASAR